MTNKNWHKNGELPPVGCVCLSPEGDEVEIVGHGFVSGVPVAIYPYKIYGICVGAPASMFTPLRTEREKAIEEMSLLAIDCEKYNITQNVAKAICELLYDAGYRKQEEA